MKRQPYTPTQASEALKGLETNAKTLRESIAQRETRRSRTNEEREGNLSIIAQEKARLAEIEKEIEFLKTSEEPAKP